MAERDFYEVLGVPHNADGSEINRAFRALAAIHHPDRNQGSEKAEAIYKRISEAYETLKDPTRRHTYDSFLKKRRQEHARRIRFSFSVAVLAAIVCVPAVLIALAKVPRSTVGLAGDTAPVLLSGADTDAGGGASIRPKDGARDAGIDIAKTAPAKAAADAAEVVAAAPVEGAGPALAGSETESAAVPAGSADAAITASLSKTDGDAVSPTVKPLRQPVEKYEPEDPAANQPARTARLPLADAGNVAVPNSRLAALKLEDERPHAEPERDARGMRRLAPDLVEIAVGPPGLERMTTLRLGGGPSATFRDCEQCPEMTVLPPGAFAIGARGGEDGWSAAEGPSTIIAFSTPFAVSRSEISAAEWAACVAEHGCSGRKSGNAKYPVGQIVWKDALDYTAWLSRKTGKTYRLLSEAEWEYAARANAQSAYWWGDWISPGQANYASELANDHTGAVVVDAGRPNPWGLHHVHGNLAEWVADCWSDSHHGIPADGAPRMDGDCTKRVLKGGSWRDGPGEIRAASRRPADVDFRDKTIGFRVARTL